MSQYYRTQKNLNMTMSPMNIVTATNYSRMHTPTISKSPSLKQIQQPQTYSRIPSTTIMTTNSQINGMGRKSPYYTPTRVMISHQITQQQPQIQAPVRIKASPNRGRRSVSKSPSNVVSRVSDIGVRQYRPQTREQIYPINGFPGQKAQTPIIYNHVTISPPRSQEEGKNSVVWKKFEDVDDELKHDCKEVIGNMSNSIVDESHGVLDAYNVLSRAENRDLVDYNRRDLDGFKDQFRRANERHRRELADIIDQMRDIVQPNSSSFNELENISNNVRYIENSQQEDPSVLKREMIDLSMISDPDISGYTNKKTLERDLINMKRTEIGLTKNPSYVSKSRTTNKKRRGKSRKDRDRRSYKERSTDKKKRRGRGKGINLTKRSNSPEIEGKTNFFFLIFQQCFKF